MWTPQHWDDFYLCLSTFSGWLWVILSFHWQSLHCRSQVLVELLTHTTHGDRMVPLAPFNSSLTARILAGPTNVTFAKRHIVLFVAQASLLHTVIPRIQEAHLGANYHTAWAQLCKGLGCSSDPFLIRSLLTYSVSASCLNKQNQPTAHSSIASIFPEDTVCLVSLVWNIVSVVKFDVQYLYIKLLQWILMST